MTPDNVIDASPPVTVGAGRGDKKDPGNIFNNPLDPSYPGVDGDSLYIAQHNGGEVHIVMDMGMTRRVTVVEVYGGVFTGEIPGILKQFPARIRVLHGPTASGPWTQASEYHNATEPTEFGYARIPLPASRRRHPDAVHPP
jgi:hypothetical protein